MTVLANENCEVGLIQRPDQSNVVYFFLGNTMRLALK